MRTNDDTSKAQTSPKPGTYVADVKQVLDLDSLLAGDAEERDARRLILHFRRPVGQNVLGRRPPTMHTNTSMGYEARPNGS